LHDLAWISLSLAVKDPTIGRNCAGLISAIQSYYI
jgi:hypothetical protein